MHTTRHRLHATLAAGLTAAALIGSQTLAVLDRTVTAQPVTFGNPALTPSVAAASLSTGMPTRPGKKAKTTATADANGAGAYATPTGKPKPSLNISDSNDIQPAPVQPAPFSLSSR